METTSIEAVHEGHLRPCWRRQKCKRERSIEELHDLLKWRGNHVEVREESDGKMTATVTVHKAGAHWVLTRLAKDGWRVTALSR
jgi:hypothetical protein